MKTEPFVHLHLHTAFSLLDGACRINQIMETALENNMPSVAITDHGVLYGAIDFYKAAKDKGIRPVIGCETYIAYGSRFDRKSTGQKVPANHLVLLATNNTGYYNLIKLVSLAHLEGFYYKPRIDKEILSKHHEGLIGLSACLKGEIASLLTQDDMKGAIRAAGEYADILGKDNFFLEIQDHNIAEQRKVNKLMPELSKKTGLELVATNDVHYLKKEHAAAHEIMLCLQTQTVMSDPKRMRYQSNEFYMKTREEMENIFKEFPDAINRTVEIAERCNVELEFNRLHFPTFQVPEDKTHKQYLIDQGHKGVKARYNIENPLNPKNDQEQSVLDRFNMELEVIEKTGFINYFLVVWDFIRFAMEKNIPVGPGRGSGGGSLVAYVLGITAIDPLYYGLIFERFLNPSRISPPDFDIDFCQARRGEVIEYVREKYGKENVAQIITFGSLGAKMVIRDVGRVLEIPYDKCDKLSKMVPGDPKITLKQALDMNPELKKAYSSDKDCKRILDFGFVLEGLYRNPGTHAAGVVIGEKPLMEIIPLARDKNKETITQYTMEPLGDIGLLKMDFLGLKTLTVINEAIKLIEESTGKTIDINNIPMDDKPTYELLNLGNTIGIFQLESTGMRDLIRRVGIERIEDLIAMIALYRPGPMNMLDDYVNRKTGKAKIRFDHPLLEPVLKETYGVMLYQEQVQKSANVLAGYSLAEGDILRRAMGKKKKSVMDKQREKFVSGCKAKHINSMKAGKIFDTIAKFAGYGFNKSHSTAYAIIAYQTAFFKANYPAEFMSALLSNEIGNFDKLPVFIAEASEMGLEILPPDINSSNVRFMPVENAIRFGLAGIKNVGQGAAEAIVAEHRKNGSYKGLIDFFSRLDSQMVNRKTAESLVRCGAFDSVGMHRARLFNGIDFAMIRAANTLHDRRSGQSNLFDLLDESPEENTSENIPDCKLWHENQLLSGEKELLGIYMSGHPLTKYAPLLEKYQLTTVPQLADLPDKSSTRLGGIIAQVTKRITKRKESMAIVQMEDLDGSFEVLVFPETYQKYNVHLVQNAAIMVCGEVQKREDPPKLVSYEIYPLDETPKHFTNFISVHVPAVNIKDSKLKKVKDILRMHPGTIPVKICLQFPSGEKVFMETDKSLYVFPGQELIRELEHELGEEGVYLKIKSQPYAKPRQPRKYGQKNG
ncbi:DNA polymerase III subunit alpha [Verrucomicrobiota bacterium]